MIQENNIFRSEGSDVLKKAETRQYLLKNDVYSKKKTGLC